jgi:hypothetical protein
MTNIVTRKGIAFGALVALASTAIAGAPALAAGELNVVPEAGTSLNIAAGSVFNLKTTFAPGYTPSSYAQLKYLVKTDANSAINAKAGLASVAAPQTGGTVVAVSTTSSAISATATSATDVAYLGLSAVTTSVTSAVEVTAFVDANNDGALTAGEWNTVKTVTFKKAADIVPVVTLTQPSTGDTTVKATVVWGDLNIEQMSAETVKFTVGTQVASATAGSLADGVWSKGSLTALASAEAVTAQAYDGSTALGTAASATATARTINTTNGLVANVLAGNDAIATSATAIATNTAATVRTNGSFTAQVKAFDTTAGTALAKAGVAVVGKVTATTTATDLRPASTGVTEISVTVNGTKYTSETTLNAATVDLTTDASGLASLNISSVGLVASDVLTVSFAAQNLTSAVVATQADAAYTVSDDAAAAIVATSKNTAASFNFTVKDQFGVLSARTNERLVVSATNAVTATQYIAVTAGKATFSVTPATDSVLDVVVTSALEVSTNTNGTISWAANGTNAASRTVKVRSAAYDFATAPALAEVAGAAYNATTNASQVITQVVQSDSAATGYVAPASNSTYAKITLTGSNAGEALTVTGSGVYLSIDGAAVTADKATKVAQAAAAVVYVASNTVGTKTITITNGTVTKTVDVVFVSAASAESTATTFAVAVAAAAQSGRAIDATVTVTDKWGNPVAGFDVTASVSGVASVNGGFSAAVTTGTDGKATVKLSAGVNDLGDAVVTFSDNDSNTSTNVTSVAKTVTFGSTDGYIDVLNGKRASVTWSFAKGKRVAVYLDGVRRYNIVQPGDSELNLQFNLKKGSHSIKLVIGGVIVDTLSVKVAG